MNRENGIADVSELEEMLSEPTAGLVEIFKRLLGDVMILGAAGKMGPTLTRMAKRASDAAALSPSPGTPGEGRGGGASSAFKSPHPNPQPEYKGRESRKIIAVSRFSNPKEKENLEAAGVVTISADLLDEKQLDALPAAQNVVYMAGMKFGSAGNLPMTWAMNTLLPALVCRKFKDSRIAAFSTGNVYGLSPVNKGGSVESDPLQAVGEYAMSCVGRERMFEYYSQANKTRVAILRLNYATEMRYGVMVDLAQKVWREEPISLAMGHFNVIWQGDANAMSLMALGEANSPAVPMNIAGPEMLSVRQTCESFGRMMGKQVRFEGKESGDALLNNASKSHQLFGKPRIKAEQLMQWIADWTMRGGTTINKPTHFESRDGKF